jgi:hypothetical protein
LFYTPLFIQELVGRVERFYGRPRLLDAAALAHFPYATLLLADGQNPEIFAGDFPGYSISSIGEIDLGSKTPGIVCRLTKLGAGPQQQESGDLHQESPND